ncbi:acyltransferase [Novosphingobium sp.]|uniref:acyltransferase family protein n=1 Tax=Novosphingobium sp. TaxID=1874826 RepID=UPI002601166B|nr:acyltransferase [Novosphingobium sp.]
MDSRKLAFVDRMRGIAILLVMAMHYLQVFASPVIRDWGELGQIGVQVFFVASAYTLCLSANQRREEAHPVLNFYIRRYFRIAPLYYLGIAFYAWMFTISGEGAPYTPGNIVANLVFVHGLVPAANNNVVPGGWTIGTEMLFYLLFPALFPTLSTAWNRWGVKALCAFLAISFALAISWQMLFRLHFGAWLPNNGFAYGAIINQAPVFACGMAWFFAVSRGGLGINARRDWALACVVAVACLLILGLEQRPFYGFIPALAGLGAVALGNALRADPREGGWLAAIGKVSFSLYIIHFALVWRPSAWLLKAMAGTPWLQEAALVPLFAAEVAVLYAFARLTWICVEQPANRLARSLIERYDNSKETAISAVS